MHAWKIAARMRTSACARLCRRQVYAREWTSPVRNSQLVAHMGNLTENGARFAVSDHEELPRPRTLTAETDHFLILAWDLLLCLR